MERTHNVAVYGSLRAGLHNHRLLQAAPCLGVTTADGWDMYSMGGFPFITHGTGTIKIEVYSVDPIEMARLDMLEGYPSFYNRELIKTPYGDAWIYFIDGNDTTRYEPVPEGDWFRFYKDRN